MSIDSGVVRRADDQPPRVSCRVTEADRHAVLRDPTGQAVPDRDAQLVGRRGRAAEHGPLERQGLAHAGLVIDPIDPDRVVLGQPLGLSDDGPGDGLEVIELAEAAGELRDRGQAIGERPARIGQPGTADGGGHLVAEGAGQRAFVGRPCVGLAVVQDQQAERLVAEDERDEADRADADRAVDRPKLRGRGAHGPVEHADAAGGGGRPSRSSVRRAAAC